MGGRVFRGLRRRRCGTGTRGAEGSRGSIRLRTLRGVFGIHLVHVSQARASRLAFSGRHTIKVYPGIVEAFQQQTVALHEERLFASIIADQIDEAGAQFAIPVIDAMPIAVVGSFRSLSALFGDLGYHRAEGKIRGPIGVRHGGGPDVRSHDGERVEGRKEDEEAVMVPFTGRECLGSK